MNLGGVHSDAITFPVHGGKERKDPQGKSLFTVPFMFQS